MSFIDELKGFGGWVAEEMAEDFRRHENLGADRRRGVCLRRSCPEHHPRHGGAGRGCHRCADWLKSEERDCGFRPDLLTLARI